MKCYLVRHGQDDDSVRGGWSNHGLTSIGVEQVKNLAKEISEKGLSIGKIYSSDLERAKESALIISNSLNIPITYLPEFREVNNGDLAGIKNDIANEKYPGLFWLSLEYSECYPNGESPEMFYDRIRKAWIQLKNIVLEDMADVLLVTHGGVMEVILCIENGIEFTNKKKHFSTPSATLIPVEINR